MRRPPINLTDGQIEQMLRARSASAPPHLLDEILDTAAATPQRSRRWRRWLGGLRNALAPVAVALVVLAIIGSVVAVGTILRRLPDSIGGPTETRQLPVAFDWVALEPGRYRIDSRFRTSVPFTFAVASGWAAENHGQTISKFPDTMREVGWAYFVLDDVYGDACALDADEVPIGNSVDDLMQALLSQPGTAKSGPVDIVIDGHPGRRLDLTAPSSVSADECAFRLWQDDGSYGQALLPDGVVSVYAIDVRGDRVVIATQYRAESSPADVAELEAMINTIRFVD